MNYGYPKLRLYLWISKIHFRITINRFEDIQYSTDFWISKMIYGHGYSALIYGYP